MRILIQRVKQAAVAVNQKCTGRIGEVLFVFVGIGKDDLREDLERLAVKVANLRIFENEQGKMNLNGQVI